MASETLTGRPARQCAQVHGGSGRCLAVPLNGVNIECIVYSSLAQRGTGKMIKYGCLKSDDSG